jgi:uncharacterized protein
MKKYFFLLLGIAFGFVLSRAGATTYDFYAELFLFQNFQLLWVIVFAALVGFVGTRIMKAIKIKSLVGQEEISYKGKPYKKSLIPGSIIFGLGWGLAGACPGTVLAMLGEGKLGAIFTIFGILIGTWFYGLRMSKTN